MVRKFNLTAPLVILVIIFCGIIAIQSFANLSGQGTEHIANLTDNWINAVTVKNNAQYIASLFCKDANLFGSISQTNRTGTSIAHYFNYFANIPGLQVLDRKYHIRQIANNVYLNSALVTWKWDAIKEPVLVRMSFLFKGNCITHLHGCGLPELHEDLKNNPYPII
jgi:hypothetical protein